jgi:uncharacterized protein
MSRSAAALKWDISVDCVDLEALDRFLTSQRAPADAMLISDLDGFLTGIAVGPELVMPSEWLPLVWGGQEPEFADEAEAATILGTIMARYNEILRDIAADTFEPIMWADRDGALIPFAWADGFLQAIALRAEAWQRLFKSKRHGFLLLPILALCSATDELLPDLSPEEEDRLTEQMIPCISPAVIRIARYWREHGSKEISLPLTHVRAFSDGPSPKIGRNDPCPCGSGKKYKKCCWHEHQNRYS